MGGHYNGHCGRDVYGGYLKCTRSNMMCGSLQCQDGTSNPILQSTLSSTTVSRIVLTLDRQEHECKNLNSPKGDSAAANLELVRDGTRCGEEMVLIYFKNHQCHTFWNISNTKLTFTNQCVLDLHESNLCQTCKLYGQYEMSVKPCRTRMLWSWRLFKCQHLSLFRRLGGFRLFHGRKRAPNHGKTSHTPASDRKLD